MMNWFIKTVLMLAGIGLVSAGGSTGDILLSFLGGVTVGVATFIPFDLTNLSK